MHPAIRWLLASLLALASGCAGSPPGTQPGTPDSGLPPQDAGTRVDAGQADAGQPDAGVELAITVLREATTDAGAPFKLLRLQFPGRSASYAQYFPPAVADGGKAPIVVLTQPYDGIDWTGEEVDQRWASYGPGLHPDIDGPNFQDGGSSIVYSPLSPEGAADSAFLWRFHQFGVLMLYGRYYAGRDVQNDIDDMTIGFDFLATRPEVDRSHIGIMGGSWGGFEALYGAAYARPDVRPTVGVALYPLSDFEMEVNYVTQTLPARYTLDATRTRSASFFEPYLRRLAVTTQRNGGYSGLRGSDLIQRIHAPFLVLHEDWDTLVSFEQSTSLVAQAPGRFEPMWLLHEAPPSPWDIAVTEHGLILKDYGSLGSYPFVWAYLLAHLGGAAQPLYVPWDKPSFEKVLTLMHSLQVAGKDVGFFAKRLATLCDPRVSTYELTSQAVVPGPTTLAVELNAVWGTQLTPANVCAALAVGLP